jgi:hypothetical protein
MALKKCKDCGNSVSSSAKACPQCGAPMQSRGVISSLARLFVIVFVIIPIGIAIFMSVYQSETSPSSGGDSTTSRAPDPKETALSNIELKNLSWQKAGFDNVMEVSVTFVNKGARDVKDIELKCEHFSNSGTRIDSNKKTIYEVVPAGKSKSIKNFNMGFIHSQAAKTSCFVSDVVLM